MDQNKRADYSGLSGRPYALFQPKNTRELQDILKANGGSKFRIGGGLSGVSGGAVPFENEIFLETVHFNKIDWYDKNSGIIMVESGVKMSTIADFAENSEWGFEIIPGSKDEATIGGMIACNGGAPMSLKFGKIGAQVLLIEAVLPNGKMIKAGSLSTKKSEGVNIKDIWVGSEGTFGIITKVFLRCTPKLPSLNYYRIEGNFYKLLEIVPNLLKLDPYIIELANENAMLFSSKVKNSVMWVGMAQIIKQSDFPNYQITSQSKEVIKERFVIGHNLQTYKTFIDLDICFPLKTVKSGLQKLEALLNKNELEHVIFGHAGDGNYHIHVFNNDDNDTLQQVLPAFDQILLENEGVISGEHGIGRVHSKRLSVKSTSEEKAVYTALKKYYDPNNQLPNIY